MHALVVMGSAKHSKQFLNEKTRKISSLDMENYSRKKQLGENILCQKNDTEKKTRSRNYFIAQYQTPPIRRNFDHWSQVVECTLILSHEH